MKGLTRPCADFVESQDVDAEGHRQVGIELALKPTFFEQHAPLVYWKGWQAFNLQMRVRFPHGVLMTTDS